MFPCEGCFSKKLTNMYIICHLFQSHDEEFKVSYLKTQSEGAMVDADDRIVDIAEDKDIVCFLGTLAVEDILLWVGGGRGVLKVGQECNLNS